MTSILEQGFEAQARILRDFGYPDVTVEMVAEAHADWRAGKEPANIIARFCESAFEECPRVFGKQDA